MIKDFRVAMTVAILVVAWSWNDQFCAAQVYGHAVFAGRVSSGGGRSSCVLDRNLIGSS